MGQGTVRKAWQLWARQPQSIWLRRALFQVHLWTGIGIGLYVLMISLTGSILVFSNELFVAATPKPIISTSSAPRLSNQQLSSAAERVYPGYQVESIIHARNRDAAVDIWLGRGGREKERMFDPRTGADLGDSVPLGMRFVSGLKDLHDNLFGGPTGRKLNGIGALIVIVLVFTGLVVWWPGIGAWQRSLVVHRRVGWKRWVWELHSMVGFWSLGFILLFTLSGIYLANPAPFEDFAERYDSLSNVLDTIIYWFAILHFGRVNGIGFLCSGPGLCDKTVKIVWAFFGLTPAVMFTTGAIMWWNRVLRPRWLALARRGPAETVRA